MEGRLGWIKMFLSIQNIIKGQLLQIKRVPLTRESSPEETFLLETRTVSRQIFHNYLHPGKLILMNLQSLEDVQAGRWNKLQKLEDALRETGETGDTGLTGFKT